MNDENLLDKWEKKMRFLRVLQSPNSITECFRNNRTATIYRKVEHITLTFSLNNGTSISITIIKLTPDNPYIRLSYKNIF